MRRGGLLDQCIEQSARFRIEWRTVFFLRNTDAGLIQSK
jgi:hypothetical protein